MSELRPEPRPPLRYRFGAFELDTVTGELRRQGIRVKLNTQPFQVLTMLLARPGELLTREQIARELWPDGTFVDFEQGVNSAVNRLRESLKDTAGNPRFVETLARRGYRFIAPVERIGEIVEPPAIVEVPVEQPPKQQAPEPAAAGSILASEQDLPKTPHRTVRTLFVLLQLMYVAFYVGALANLAEIEELFSAMPHPAELLLLLIVTAAIMIPVRVFLLTAVGFRAPRLREQFLRIWPFLLLLDVLWALSPVKLLHQIKFGQALACTAILVYAPFAQRSLMLMGVSEAD
jgi:cholera toxin transcriptional activator